MMGTHMIWGLHFINPQFVILDSLNLKLSFSHNYVTSRLLKRHPLSTRSQPTRCQCVLIEDRTALRTGLVNMA